MSRYPAAWRHVACAGVPGSIVDPSGRRLFPGRCAPRPTLYLDRAARLVAVVEQLDAHDLAQLHAPELVAGVGEHERLLVGHGVRLPQALVVGASLETLGAAHGPNATALPPGRAKRFGDGGEVLR